MTLDRKRPTKLDDDELLIEIARLQDRVIVGPTTREIEEAMEVSNGTVFRHAKQLTEAGLVKNGYRGIVLTEKGEQRVKAMLAEEA